MTAPERWRLAVLTRTQQMADEIDATLVRMVTGARRDGHTWREIGAALGVTPQAAQQRFSHRITEPQPDEQLSPEDAQ